MIDRANRLRLVSAVLTCGFLSFGTPASGENILPMSNSELLEYADVIVVASPAGMQDPHKRSIEWFVVQEVLRGDSALKSRWIRVNVPRHRFVLQLKSVRHALLFLRRFRNTRDSYYEPVFSGVPYLLSRDGKVLVPRQDVVPGPYTFHVDEGANWEAMLKVLRDVMPFRNAMRSAISDDLAPDWVKLLPSGRRRQFAFEIIIPPPCKDSDFSLSIHFAR